MKNKHFFILILLSLSLVFASCTNTYEKPMNPAGKDTDESSIFELGEIRNCRITADNVPVKTGAGNDYNTIGSLKKDDIVNVLGQVGNWYVVRMDNNQVGCIDSTNAEPVVVEGQDGQPKQIQPPQQVQKPGQGQQPGVAPGQQQGENAQPDQQPTPKPNQQPSQLPAPRTPEPQQPQGGNTAGLTAQEQQMVDLVNQERQKNDLPPLEVDLEVARVANIKSQDLVDQNYFSHNSPTYGSPFDMLKSFGVEYLTAGENLAGNSTVTRAHNALMNSSGHRQNILSPSFTHIGIGIKPSDKYGYMFTQMFIGK